MNPLPEPEALLLPGGRSIKPVEPGAGFAREAESVDRLAADAELIHLLMWAQYEGHEWRKFREALAQYGVAVLKKWILSGQIFRECIAKGFGAIHRRRRNDEEEALGIAGETVARAIVFFRERVLVRGVWDPSRGASVRTYFIGACILHFPNVYDLVQGGERLEAALVREDDARTQLSAIEDVHPSSRPDHRAEVLRAFDELPDDQARFMVLRRAEGYSDGEIAGMLNTTFSGALVVIHPSAGS